MSDEQRLQKIQTDPRPTDELIQLALSQNEETRAYKNTLLVLHFRGTREVLEAARELCRSTVPKERLVGVDILGELGDSARMLRKARAALADNQTISELREHYADDIKQLADVIGEAQQFPEEAVQILIDISSHEEDERVLQSIADALEHYTRTNHAAIEALAKLAMHPNTDVRKAVALSLRNSDTPLAVSTLIKLLSDGDTGVRDWTTYTLVHFIESDSNEIHEALVKRLTDEDDNIYSEAVYDLARLGDARVIDELLSKRLPTDDSDYTSLLALIYAGKLIGDPRLLPLLLKEKKEWDELNTDTEDDERYQDLLTAIARCMQER